VTSLTLDPSNLYTVTPVAYPQPEMMHFAESNENEPVYRGPFRKRTIKYVKGRPSLLKR
jgi:hypothetical protein